MTWVIPAALAIMAASTGAQIYGAHRQKKETEKSLRAYQQAVANKVAQDKRALGELMNIQGGFAAQRQADIGRYLTGLAEAWKTQPIQEEAALRQAVPVSSDYGTQVYGGAPVSQWTQSVEGQRQLQNRLLAKALLEQHRQKAVQAAEQMAGYRLTEADLMRAAAYAPIQRRFQLAQALRDLDWEKQAAAFQASLNKAQQAGQWHQLLGGLGQQAGGLLLLYGAAKATAPGAAAGQPPPRTV